MALFTPSRSPDMNTRTGLAPKTLPVHLMLCVLEVRNLGLCKYHCWAIIKFLSKTRPVNFLCKVF